MVRIGLVTFSILLALTMQVFAHDVNKPQFDDFYRRLVNPHHPTGGSSPSGLECCSQKDCHETDAEIRDGHWWARLGKRYDDGTWELTNWVMVPPYAFLTKTPNPTGEAVICHATSEIFCFVPGLET